MSRAKHHPKNAVGPMIRRIRTAEGMSQDQLAVKLQVHGWFRCTRSWLAKIEAQQAYVRDYELLYFGKVFALSVDSLYSTLSPEAVDPEHHSDPSI